MEPPQTPDDPMQKYYGGNLWKAPSGARRLICAVPCDDPNDREGRGLAMINDPREGGLTICTDTHGRWLYNEAELAVYLTGWEHLGQFRDLYLEEAYGERRTKQDAGEPAVKPSE